MEASHNDILNLQYSSDGSPFVRVSVVDSSTLEFSVDGSTWYGRLIVNDFGIVRRVFLYIGGQWVAKPVLTYDNGTWVERELIVL